ncbi:MAG: DUF3793 family protein [Ruminococcus sp.]|nr:DUF3793 family protein [Ruminococcus sp.]
MSLEEKCFFEKKIAFHTAPALCGVKCASLISLDCHEFDIPGNVSLFNLKAGGSGIYMRALCECKSRALLLVYNKSLLTKRLGESRVRVLLRSCGYGRDLSLDKCLDTLADRIRSGGDFPHEIGVFLGYPIDDVIGFIKNGGENFKLCGCWKVYSNADKAKKTFKQYDRCRDYLCSKLNKGLDIYQALGI